MADVKRRLTLAVAALLMVGCSQTVTHRIEPDGACIVHDTHRVFGLPLDQSEYKCEGQK